METKICIQRVDQINIINAKNGIHDVIIMHEHLYPITAIYSVNKVD